MRYSSPLLPRRRHHGRPAHPPASPALSPSNRHPRIRPGFSPVGGLASYKTSAVCCVLMIAKTWRRPGEHQPYLLYLYGMRPNVSARHEPRPTLCLALPRHTKRFQCVSLPRPLPDVLRATLKAVDPATTAVTTYRNYLSDPPLFCPLNRFAAADLTLIKSLAPIRARSSCFCRAYRGLLTKL